jgi:hypothetical protein
VAIFRRGRKDDPVDPADELGGTDEPELDDVPAATDDSADDAAEERLNRTRGPFDASEVADDDVERIDLGALRIAPIEGMQLRLELDQEQQSVVSAHALVGDSGVQLQVFAAPRTIGVWSDIRTEIADSITAQGGKAEVVDGPLGRELAATIAAPGPDGRPVQNVVRFMGVDGPRWFLRAVVSGPAATDAAKAAPLVEVVRSTVVVRDDEARPPREALPLRIPVAPGDEPAADSAEEPTEPAEPSRRAEDLKPFERGPEITEVR